MHKILCVTYSNVLANRISIHNYDVRCTYICIEYYRENSNYSGISWSRYLYMFCLDLFLNIGSSLLSIYSTIHCSAHYQYFCFDKFVFFPEDRIEYDITNNVSWKWVMCVNFVYSATGIRYQNIVPNSSFSHRYS